MLAVVQDHQGRALGEVLGERVRQRSTRDLADTDRRRHGRRDEGGVGERREIDEPDTVAEVLQEAGAGLQGQSGLPRAPGPDEGDEAVLVHQVGDGRQVGRPADEARQLDREVVAKRVERGERRERRRQARVVELEDPLGDRQVAQPMLAEVLQRGTSGSPPRTSAAVVAEMRTCPPWASARRRAHRLTSGPR